MIPYWAVLSLISMTLSHAGASGPSTRFPGNQGLPGTFDTYSSRPLKEGALIMGLSSRWIRDISLAEDALIRSEGRVRHLEDAFTMHTSPFLAAGVGYGIDISLLFPVYYEYFPGAPADKMESWGSGDLAAQFKIKLPWDTHFLSMAGIGMVTLPTSSDGGLLPRQLAYHPYDDAFPDAISHPFGMDRPRIGAGLGITFDLTNALGP